MLKSILNISLLLLLVFVLGINGLPTARVKEYDLQVQGSRPIKIIEESDHDHDSDRDPAWNQHRDVVKMPSTTMNNIKTIKNPQEEEPAPTTEDSAKALKEFLKKYSQKVKPHTEETSDDKKFGNNENNNFSQHQLLEEDERTQKGERPKSWGMQNEKNNYPYEDKKNWVSLEAVPWSISKISKWKGSKPNTNNNNHDNIEHEHYHSNANAYTNTYSNHGNNNNNNFHHSNGNNKRKHTYTYTNNKPSTIQIYDDEYQRPISSTSSGFNIQSHYDNVDYPSTNNNQYFNNYNNNNRRGTYGTHSTSNKNCDNNNHIHSNNGIITDGLAPNFPRHDYISNRRQGGEVYPPNHPFSGDGDWVLLTTTKGYKFPKRIGQRALQLNSDSIGAHRGVRLTVLPPDENSKVNMTTSHGGLLQVEQTFNTVEQDQKIYARRERLKKQLANKKNNIRVQKQVATVPPTVNQQQPSTSLDTSSVLAAVGAGLIPASMAMLVPIMNGKRKKRHLSQWKKLDDLDSITVRSMVFH